MQFLPIDLPDNQYSLPYIVPKLPKKTEIEELHKLSKEFHGEYNTIACYLQDLRVEAQNYLVASLFKNNAEHRKPLDPSCIVIKTDDNSLVKLKTHFENTEEYKEMYGAYKPPTI